MISYMKGQEEGEILNHMIMDMIMEEKSPLQLSLSRYRRILPW